MVLDTSDNVYVFLVICIQWVIMSSLQDGALNFRKEINNFVGRHRDHHAWNLMWADWEAILQVAGWLKAFCSATMEMSKAEEPMLSMAHAFPRGL